MVAVAITIILGGVKEYKGKLIFKVGDIIRGRVFSLLNSSIHITLEDKDLGLVYTICFSCGN